MAIQYIRRHFHVTIIRHLIIQKHFMKQWHNHTIQPEPGFIPLPCSELRQGRQYSGYIKSAARRFLKSRNARLRMPYGRDMKSWQVYMNICMEVWLSPGNKLQPTRHPSSVQKPNLALWTPCSQDVLRQQHLKPESVIRTPIRHLSFIVSYSSFFRTAAIILSSAFSLCSPLHLR